MTPLELKTAITDKLNKSVIGATILLNKARLIDEASRKSPAFSDPMYLPFYYHLGTLIQPKAVMEMGLRLGLHSGCFFRGCQTADNFLGFQQRTDSFYSDRLARANVRDWYKRNMDVYVGNTTDEAFRDRLAARTWDLALVNDEASYDKHMEYLDLAWASLGADGLLVTDSVSRHGPAGQALADFCKANSREPVHLPTRYGIGMIQK